MKMIFIDEKHGASRSVVLKGWMRLGLSLCLLGLPVFLGYYSFQFSENRSPEQKDAAAQAWVDGLREQKADLERVRQKTLSQLDVLSTRMASLQARLGALGERFTHAAGMTGYSGERQGFGGLAQGAHARSVELLYGQDQKLLVKLGDAVRKGQIIALSGFPGLSSGFTVHKNGRVVDPASYIHSTSR